MEKLYFVRENKKIFYYLWNAVGNVKGIIQISHGMAEHAKRYDEIAKIFNKNGYIVVADDHRGHGETDVDSLGYCDGDMAYETVLDMLELLKITKEKYKNKKYILFGFSYGSFLTQKFLEKNSYKIDAVVIGGSNKNKKLPVKFGKFITKLNIIFKNKNKPAKFVKKMTFDIYDKKFKDSCFLSNNKNSNLKYFEDKLCAFICSYNFYDSFFNMLDSLYTKQYAKNLNKDLKMLIVSGQEDAVGEMGKGVKRLYTYYKKVGMKNVDLILYPNSRHEFLNEENADKYLNDIISFCDKV